MRGFIQNSKRSVELPFGCKDLIDVDSIRNWRVDGTASGLISTADRLAYVDGQLSRLLEANGPFPLVSLSHRVAVGRVSIIRNTGLFAPVLSVHYNGPPDERAVRYLLEESEILLITEPVGNRRTKNVLQSQLPADTTAAVQLIGRILREGYGLDEFNFVWITRTE